MEFCVAPPLVFALGSCRLIGPMKKLNEKGIIRLTNRKYSWYAHNAQEMHQRIEIMLGKTLVPSSLASFILDFDSCKTNLMEPITDFDLGDIGVFEISTLAVRSYNNFVLHSMCINKQNFKKAHTNIVTYDILEQDILKLNSYFKSIILVCNIDRDDTLMCFDERRQRLNKFLYTMENKYKSIKVFNPNDFISDNIKENLKDHNHFTPKFFDILFHEYSDFFKKILV